MRLRSYCIGEISLPTVDEGIPPPLLSIQLPRRTQVLGATRAFSQRISTTPWRRAKTRACSWECTPSLERMLAMWLRSVLRLMCSLSAISSLSKPSARASKTSLSLSGGEALYSQPRLVLLFPSGGGEAQQHHYFLQGISG